jgi:ABC-type uncharacterized transport system involved in gliding motility auxiliary subunit
MKKTLSMLLCVLLFTLALALVNGISRRVFTRVKLDVSEDRLYSVSDTSRQLLRELDSTLQLKLFLSYETAKSSPPMLVAMDHVRHLLQEYEREAGGKISLEVLEVSADSDEEIWADKYGLMPYRFSPTERVFFGLVGTNAAGKEEVIPVFSPIAESTLEYHLTKNVYSLSRKTKPKVAVLSTLEIGGRMRKPTAMTVGNMPYTRSWGVVDELKKIADLDFIDLDEPTISSDVKLLIVIHPKKLSPLHMFAIDQFVVGGGKLILLEDPFCGVDLAGAESTELSMGLDRSSSLNELTKQWGFELRAGEIVADNNLATLVTTPTSGKLDDRFSLWLTLMSQTVGEEEVISRADQITKNISELNFPWIGSFEISNSAAATITPLLSTTRGASAISDKVYRATGGSIDAVNQAYKSLEAQRTLALRARGKFKSAFKEPPQEVMLLSGGTTPSMLTEGRDEAEIVAIADVDFISDDFALARQALMGAPISSLVNDNIALLLSAVEELSGVGSFKLAGLRSKGRVFRPFERVQQLEAIAVQQYQGEEAALVEKLRSTNAELEKLQETGEGKDQSAILEKIQAFRKDRWQTQERLRELRFNLRRDKESLGSWLFGLNTFLVPAFLIIFSLLRSLKSRS